MLSLQLLSFQLPLLHCRAGSRSPTTSWCSQVGPRRWRVRHIPKVASPGSLRVNVMVGVGERFHVDTVDLYSAKRGRATPRRPPPSCDADRDTLKAELGQVLLAVEDAQARRRYPAGNRRGGAPWAQPSAKTPSRCSARPTSWTRWRRRSPRSGVVGEQTSALTAWLTLTSRLSDRPLGAVIQSSSSAGKSTLADAALALMPTEATVAYSAMTGQALYYLGESDLAHKVLSIAEEEGASRASYALKLLVSEGRLSIAAAGKDPLTGRLVTNTYEVTGPVALLMTTTSAELDEELANRLLGPRRRRGAPPDPGRPCRPARRRDAGGTGRPGQAGRGDRPPRQRPAPAQSGGRGEPPRSEPRVLATARPATAGTTPSTWVSSGPSPWPTSTSGRGTRSTSRARRSPTSRPPPPTWPWPRQLCAHVLGTTTDELSPATRNLLSAIVDFTATDGSRFTRRELRDATGLGDSQLKVHLARLVDLEYVATERAGPSTSYELVAAADHGAATRLRRRSAGCRGLSAGSKKLIGRVKTPIGRSSAGLGVIGSTGPNPQVNGTCDPAGDLSAGIGRVGVEDEKPLSSRDNPPARARSAGSASGSTGQGQRATTASSSTEPRVGGS